MLKLKNTWSENMRLMPVMSLVSSNEADENQIIQAEDETDELQSEENQVIQAEKENIDEVAEATVYENEDVHGGDEATGDIEDSQNALDDGKNENEQGGATPDEVLEYTENQKQSSTSLADFLPDELKENSEDFENEDEKNEEEEDSQETCSDFEEEEDENKEDDQVFDNNQAFSLEGAKRKRLASAFANIISKIAQDLEGHPIPGDDEWDMQALMLRTISKRPLNRCRQSREKRSVMLILDTSYSCCHQARFYADVAQIAAETGDVEMYDAPNASVYAKYYKGAWVESEYRWWEAKNRTIIFFGDFDGGDAPVLASKNNKVYWLSSEGDRYYDMNEHDWCSFTLADFKGFYFNCLNEDDFFKIIKKIR